MYYLIYYNFNFLNNNQYKTVDIKYYDKTVDIKYHEAAQAKRPKHPALFSFLALH
jgi:hypothetical protein